MGWSQLEGLWACEFVIIIHVYSFNVQGTTGSGFLFLLLVLPFVYGDTYEEISD